MFRCETIFLMMAGVSGRTWNGTLASLLLSPELCAGTSQTTSFNMRESLCSCHELYEACERVHRSWPGLDLEMQGKIQELPNATLHIGCTLLSIL